MLKKNRSGCIGGAVAPIINQIKWSIAVAMPAVFQDVAGIALKMAVYPFKQYFNRDPKACFPNFE